MADSRVSKDLSLYQAAIRVSGCLCKKKITSCVSVNLQSFGKHIL